MAPGSIIVIADTRSCLSPGCSVVFDIAGAIWIAATSKHLAQCFKTFYLRIVRRHDVQPMVYSIISCSCILTQVSE